MKKFYSVMLAALAFAACSPDDEEAIKVKSMSILPATATVYTDQALPELALNVTPENALDGKTVTWTSSNPEVISVDADGVLAFEAKDIESAELPVTITAAVDGKTAASVITVKGQIAKYGVLDLSSTVGLLMLDRNVGASEVGKSGNYYQWGKNTPVAVEGETAVNDNYSAEWSYTSAGIVDWTVAENTPCPMGWSIPDGEQMAVIDGILEAIAMYDWGEATDEEYDAAVALLESMKVAECGQFNKDHLEIYIPTAGYFWTAYVSEDKTQVGVFENNLFPLFSKKRTFDVAVPVRCVKVAAAAE